MTTIADARPVRTLSVSGRRARRAAVALLAGVLVGGPVIATPAAAGDLGVYEPPATQEQEPLAAGVVYRLRDGATIAPSTAAAITGASAGAPIGTVAAPAGDGTVAVDFATPVPASTALRAARALAGDPAVEWAEPNYLASSAAAPPVTPRDAYFREYQWHLWDYRTGSVSGVRLPAGGYSTRALSLWPRTRGNGTVVAVLDTGITPHPDLDGRLVAGYDMISSRSAARDGNGRDADPTDEGDLSQGTASSWHGTHVAGIVGATTDRTGMAGVAPNVRIQPVRVLGAGGGTFADIAAGVTWASGGTVSGTRKNATPARVLNLSIQTEVDLACPAVLQQAIDGARARGAVVVVAAGNAAKSALKSVPANCAGVITVAALDRDGRRTPYTNTGRAVDLAAPGGSGADGSVSSYVWSTWNSGLDSPGEPTWVGMYGTSQAAPAVAGGAALLAGMGLKGAALERALLSAVSQFPAYASGACVRSQCGAGWLDLSKVLAPLGPATISGTGAVGQRVTAAVPAGFTGKVTELRYRWYRNGAAVAGATGRTYRVGTQDRGARLTVTVTPRSTGSFYARSTSSGGLLVGR
ncbi:MULTISPECIES: S8 family serine peptidase [Cellulomonas]|uniref:Extracellular protease n=1 Tax=Cellulomonas gelida TaxID=1712 RepID=A0A4Y3KFV8_9CELL|nr:MULTISPECIES: S8 family serine peptidase [Cellulomonas]MCR6703355.1 S8 family serine peptidase [Cellulomonas sp.]GEA82877.1 extracellular protease [Cellulomonas gelida]GGL34739.1 extracellular protease [Cellulomonas gelida]